MKYLIDKYFIRPVFYDYLISSFFSSGFYLLERINVFKIPDANRLLTVSSDLTTISLTFAGFILTLLTVLISFKSSIDVQEIQDEGNKSFNFFFASKLFPETILYLKNCIKSLVFISVFGFSLKLCLATETLKFLFYFNVCSVIVLTLTLFRSLLILDAILKMQNES